MLSYNVRSLRDDAQAVSTVIRSCNPDVVCIQEAPRFLRWRSKCAALARESGLVVVTGGRPAGAMLLLAALQVRVLEVADVLLTRKRGLHQRGVALATLELGGTRFSLGSIHLDLDSDERRRHVDEIVARYREVRRTRHRCGRHQRRARRTSVARACQQLRRRVCSCSKWWRVHVQRDRASEEDRRHFRRHRNHGSKLWCPRCAWHRAGE